MKCTIIDKLTNQFYCVEQTEIGRDGELTAGPNDFPYWSENIKKAFVFDSIIFAKNEMQFNDLTQDETRKPVIVDKSGNDIPNLYLVNNGNYYLQSVI